MLISTTHIKGANLNDLSILLIRFMRNAHLLNSFFGKVKYRCLATILAIFLLACDHEKTPPGVLNKEEMARALTELYVREARVNVAGISVDSASALMDYYQTLYAQKHGMSDSTLAISFQYYLERPKALSDIYDVVIDTLALREQRLNSGPQKP